MPGVAEIEIRSASADVRQIHIVPLQLAFRAISSPRCRMSRAVPRGSAILHRRAVADGDRVVAGARRRGWRSRTGPLSVPVPALATRVAGMKKAIGAILIPLGLVLCFGLVSIVGAAVREAQLEPGVKPDAARVRRSRIVMASTTLLVVALSGSETAGGTRKRASIDGSSSSRSRSRPRSRATGA